MDTESHADALRREILIALLHSPDTVVLIDPGGDLRLAYFADAK